MNHSGTIKIIARWGAVILWLGVIFAFSNQPNLKSGLDEPLDLVLRKIAHIAEYFVLAYLVYNAWQAQWSIKKRLLATILFCIMAAVGDEYHQLFVDGRAGRPVDVAIDSVGIIACVTLIYLKTYENLRHQ